MKKMYFSKRIFFILFIFAAVSIIFNVVYTAYTDNYVIAQAFVVVFQCSMLLSAIYLYRKNNLGMLICPEFVFIHLINLIKAIILFIVLVFNESLFLRYNALGFHIPALISIIILIVVSIRFLASQSEQSGDGSKPIRGRYYD